MSAGIIAGNCFSISMIDLTLTPASVAATSAPVQTFTVPGVNVLDSIIVNPPTALAGVTIGSTWVSAANTISIQFVNPTAGALVPSAGTYSITVLRLDGTTPARRVLT